MYLLELEALVDQLQEAARRDAEIDRQVARQKKAGAPVRARLRDQIGDWLISSGLKLKGQPRPVRKPAHTLR